MDDYFVLQAKNKLAKDQPWYHVRGCKNAFMGDMAPIPPTKVSIESGLQEWIIPNSQYNQSLISQVYPDFKILPQGKERIISENVAIMEGMPAAKPVEEAPNPAAVPPLAPVEDVPPPVTPPPSTPPVTPVPEPVDSQVPPPAVPEDVNAALNTTIEMVPLSSDGKDPEANGANAPDGPGAIDETKPVVITSEVEVDYFEQPNSPSAIHALKSKIVEKLTERGIKAPTTSTLPILQDLLRQVMPGGQAQ